VTGCKEADTDYWSVLNRVSSQQNKNRKCGVITMSRIASPLTLAIRKLCTETKFQITHSDARLRLQAMGLEVAPEPTEKSTNYKIWLPVAAGYVYPTKGTPEEILGFYQDTVKQAGLGANPKVVEAIMAEDKPHRVFAAEQNSFNVTKNLWSKNVNSSSVKPEISKNAKAKAAKQVVRNTTLKRKNATAKVDKPAKAVTVAAVSNEDGFAAVKFVVENGGIDGVNAKIAVLQAEIDALKQKLEAASRIGNLLKVA
jgi:hypothetical protein